MRRAAVALALALLALAGCTDDEGGADDAGASRRPITVFAAASLQTALRHTGETYSFAGSQQLATQLEEGAKADVVVTADDTTMQRLVVAGIVDTPVAVAANDLAVVTRRDDVRSLADLAKPGVTVVVADPSVPLGRLTAEALKRAGVTVSPRSLELDAAATVQKVELGEVDAAIAYRTDARESLRLVAIPPEHNVRTHYLAAVLKRTGNRPSADDFIRNLPGRLQNAGFLPA